MKRLFVVLLLVVLAVAVLCLGGLESFVSGTGLAASAGAQAAPPPHATAPTLILHNGVVIPMETEGDYEQAIAISGDTIVAVGSDAAVLSLATPDTATIDLKGRTVLPGILDPHTHLFNDAPQLGLTLDAVQQLALANGVTSIANMHTNESEAEQYLAYAKAGNMRLRLSLYLIYNGGCGEVHGTWYEGYSPVGELAPRLRVGGVKMFAERSACGPEAYSHPVFSSEMVLLAPRIHERGWDEYQLMLSPAELRAAVARAQEKGYQVAIHAEGDRGIETCLDAIESVLAGGPNVYRHMILHNWLLRDDLIGRYAETGIGALTEPSSHCERARFYRYGTDFIRLLSRTRELVATGARVAFDSDWPWWGQSTISPFVRLRCAVTETYIPEAIAALAPSCPDMELPADQTVTAWQALRMMTSEAAYALHCDDRLGSLAPGKLADLIVVTADPLKVDPETLDQIKVMMTMVGGETEFESSDFTALRTPVSATTADSALESETATTVLYRGVVVPMTSPDEAFEAIAIAGNRVLALGTDEEILALAGSETERIDLQGRAVYPGFIDPHTHLMGNCSWEGMTWDTVQDLALQNGVTGAAEMHCDPAMAQNLLAYAESGALHIRLFPYLIYNSSCGDILGTWYEQYPPNTELAPRLRVGGVKVFAERSTCGQDPFRPSFSPECVATLLRARELGWDTNRPLFTTAELREVVETAEGAGYQVAIHACGDLGVQVALDAIDAALDGRENRLRHMMLHGYFVRDDQLARFAEIGIPVELEQTSNCARADMALYVGQENEWRFKRLGDLTGTGAHVTLASDWSLWGRSSLSPMVKLKAATTERIPPDGIGLAWSQPCPDWPVTQTVTAWQALRMMTAEAAYALHCEDELGTLEPGKLADLAVLSRNPLTTEAEEFSTIQVLLTMVDGKTEWLSDAWPLGAGPTLADRTLDTAALGKTQQAVDDFEDGNLWTPLQAVWGTCPEEDWAPGGDGWHDFSALETVHAGLAARRSGAQVVERLGDRALAWTFRESGFVKLGVALPGSPGFDASGFDGAYAIVSSDSDIDVLFCFDYRQVAPGRPDAWDWRSATAGFSVASGGKQIVRIPFSEFALDDPAWKVSESDTFQNVDRRCLDLVGLMVRARAGTQTIHVHEIGFYSH